MALTAGVEGWGQCLSNSCCKTNSECCFCFLPFSVRVKILFRFLSVREDRSFVKAKRCKTHFENRGMESGARRPWNRTLALPLSLVKAVRLDPSLDAPSPHL